MILVDTGSIYHRMIFGSTKDLTNTRSNGKLETKEYIQLLLSYILEEILSLYQKTKEYGELVLCFDDHSTKYWRCDILPEYKSQRKETKDASKIDYTEVYQYLDELTETLEKYLPLKTLCVKRAEADDIILVLAKEFQEKTLIYSPDKDFIQAQRRPGVFQYSALTKKWITPETKGCMQDWIYSHISLGDVSDGVPKIVDETEFTDETLKYLKEFNISNVYDFKELKHFNKLPSNLDLFKIEYKKIRFGEKTLKKMLDNGEFKNLLESNKQVKKNFVRNAELVMEEGIPDYLRKNIILEYQQKVSNYNEEKFIEYLNKYDLTNIIQSLPLYFKSETEIDITNHGWF